MYVYVCVFTGVSVFEYVYTVLTRPREDLIDDRTGSICVFH
jgi:hypothetical protein